MHVQVFGLQALEQCAQDFHFRFTKMKLKIYFQLLGFHNFKIYSSKIEKSKKY